MDRIAIVLAQGTVLASTRNNMAQDALDMAADWTIWLDTDMRFPQDVFARLLESGHSVVTTNAPKRKEPIDSTAHVRDKDTKKMELVDITEVSDEIIRIDTCGFAVAAIATEVFKRLSKPWFWNPYLEKQDLIVGEDHYFASRLEGEGIPLMCDLELSEEIGHTGLKDYTLTDARVWKQVHEENES
jgi:hypothetical protein